MLINLSEFGLVNDAYDRLPKDLKFGNLSVHVDGTTFTMSNGVEATLNTEDFHYIYDTTDNSYAFLFRLWKSDYLGWFTCELDGNMYFVANRKNDTIKCLEDAYPLDRQTGCYIYSASLNEYSAYRVYNECHYVAINDIVYYKLDIVPMWQYLLYKLQEHKPLHVIFYDSAFVPHYEFTLNNYEFRQHNGEYVYFTHLFDDVYELVRFKRFDKVDISNLSTGKTVQDFEKLSLRHTKSTIQGGICKVRGTGEDYIIMDRTLEYKLRGNFNTLHISRECIRVNIDFSEATIKTIDCSACEFIDSDLVKEWAKQDIDIIVLGEHIVKHIGILLKTAHISIADLDNLDTRTQVGHELNQTICQTPNKDAIRIIGDYAKEWGLYGFLDSRSEMKYAEVKNGVKS